MKIIILPNYIQNKIIKLLCYNYNLINQSFKIEYIENSDFYDSVYYLNDYNIENLIFVNWYWFKTVSDNINTIINFNYKLNKRLNFNQFLNQFKKKSTIFNQNQNQDQNQNQNNNENNNENNKYLFINNNNIEILILDFSYLFNCFKLFILMSRSKIFRKLLNEKIKFDYPNLKILKINNSIRQFQIDLINSIDFSNIEIKNYSMLKQTIDIISGSNDDGKSLNQLNLIDIENKLKSKVINKKKEKQYQLGLISSSGSSSSSLNFQNFDPIKLSKNIKSVDNLNLNGGTYELISNTISQLSFVRKYCYVDSNIFQSIYNDEKFNSNNCLINSESFNINFLTFESLVSILKISPNLKKINLKFCFHHLNFIFSNINHDDDDDERNQFKSCLCTPTNQDSNDIYWNFIYNYIINSKTIKKIIFVQYCNASKLVPKVSKFCNNFEKIFNLLIENKKLKVYNLPFLKNKW
ncbi:hypothetical protein ACTFIT_003449 [Dictyostelium discoideum]